MYRSNSNNGRASYVGGGGYTKEDCMQYNHTPLLALFVIPTLYITS